MDRTFYRSNPGLWTCKITVQWPTAKEFIAEQSKKNEAARVASSLAIEWLEVSDSIVYLFNVISFYNGLLLCEQSQNKISPTGRPVLVRDLNPTVSLELDTNTVESIKDLIRNFEEVSTVIRKTEGSQKREYIVRLFFPQQIHPIYDEIAKREEEENKRFFEGSVLLFERV